MTQKTLSIYLRRKQIFVAAQAGGGGLSYDREPVFVADLDQLLLAQALKEAFASFASQAPEGRLDLRQYKSPVLARAGVGSYSQFYRGLAYCTVTQDESHFLVQRWQPDPNTKSFVPEGEPLLRPLDSSYEELATLLWQIFQLSAPKD